MGPSWSGSEQDELRPASIWQPVSLFDSINPDHPLHHKPVRCGVKPPHVEQAIEVISTAFESIDIHCASAAASSFVCG